MDHEFDVITALLFGYLQGPDDHGRRERPPRASQRDPGTEPEELSIGRGQEVEDE